MSILIHFFGACATKLALLPGIWAACAYIEHQFSPPGTSPWKPPNDRLAEILQRARLPRQWSRWLPIVLVALLPPSWLVVAGAAACAYLALRREGDRRIAVGCCAKFRAVPWATFIEFVTLR